MKLISPLELIPSLALAGVLACAPQVMYFPPANPQRNAGMFPIERINTLLAQDKHGNDKDIGGNWQADSYGLQGLRKLCVAQNYGQPGPSCYTHADVKTVIPWHFIEYTYLNSWQCVNVTLNSLSPDRAGKDWEITCYENPAAGAELTDLIQQQVQRLRQLQQP